MVLVLLRHGESEWNAKDLFAGWVDVPLSERGMAQAVAAGEELALAACGRAWVPVRRSWRLNSNHYGALQGRGKAQVRAEAGEEQFMRWRRGCDVRPPLGEAADDPRYAALPPEQRLTWLRLGLS